MPRVRSNTTDSIQLWKNAGQRGGGGRVLITAVCCLLAGAVPLAAQTQVKTMTLDEALAVAMERNRDVQKAVEYQNWLQATYVTARAVALPHLNFTGTGARQYDDTQRKFLEGIPDEFKGIFSFRQDVASWDVSLTQAVYTWGQVGAAIRAAKVGLAMGQDQLRRFQQTVRRDVTATYYDALLAEELADIAARNVELKQRHLEEAKRKYEAGVATDYDVLAGDVAVANARPAAISTANRVHTARLNLGLLLGEEGVEIDAVGDIPVKVDLPPSLQGVLESAMTRRPDLIELGHRRDVQKELVKIANAGDRPRLDLQASYGGRDIDTGVAQTGGSTWSAGLYVTFPFFDGLETRGKVAATRSELASLDLDYKKLREAIAVEARLALDAMQEAGDIVEALSGTVTEAEKLLFMAEKGYELGVKTNLDVEDALLNLLQSRGNLAKARRDYGVARVSLDWVAGTLGETATQTAP